MIKVCFTSTVWYRPGRPSLCYSWRTLISSPSRPSWRYRTCYPATPAIGSRLDKLTEAGYNLGAGPWKPRIPEKTSDEYPREWVAEVLDDYRQVVAGLEKLMTELE